MTGRNGLQVQKLTAGFGCVVTGLDLATPLDADTIEAIRRLWLEELVVVFPDQHLTPGQQVEFARQFGELTPAHPVVPGLDEHPEVVVLDAAQGGRNAQWHTDVTFVDAPPKGSLVFAEVMPPVGGDTLWADLRGAYQRLAPPLRRLVDELEAVHIITPLAYWGVPADTALTRDDATELLARAREIPAVVHPVVRVHPDTGERSLFVNPGFTSHIVGLSRVESDALLQLLYDHATQPELVLRHRWSAGDVVMWDNRSTMHYAVDDYGSVPRRIRRVTWRGDRAVGPTGIESRVEHDPLVTIR